MFDLNRASILAFANYMASLEPHRYDQTRDVHDDGSPSCLLSHLLQFFEPDTWERTTHPRNPRFMREAAERILGVKYCVTAFLYCGRPFGFEAENPTTQEAAMVLRRLADGKGATWIRDSL